MKDIFFSLLLNMALIMLLIDSFLCQQLTEVYSPSIQKQFTAKSSTEYYQDIQLAQDEGLLIIRQGSRKLLILSESDNHDIKFTFLFNEDVQGNMLVTNDAKFLIFNVSNKLTLFNFDVEKNLLTQVYQESSAEKINGMITNKNQDKIYMIKNSQDFYSISIKDFAVQKYQLQEQQVINTFIVSSDESWICISQDAVGIHFYLIISSDTNSIKLRHVYTNILVNPYYLQLIQNDSILITHNYWIGISIFQIEELIKQAKQGQTDLTMPSALLNWWVIQNQAPYSYTLDVNKEETFIFVPSRSVGFYIIDINNPSQPKIVQLIQQQEDIISIKQSFKNKYLYLQTKKRLVIYKKEAANFQNDYPNLYNKHSSTLSSVIDTSSSNQINLLSDDQHMIVCCANSGLHILKLNLNSIFEPLEIVSQISGSFKIQSYQIFSDDQMLILDIRYQNVFYFEIYDIKNLDQPIRVQKILSEALLINKMALSQDEKIFIIQDQNKFMFYQFSNLSMNYVSSLIIKNQQLLVQQSQINILSGFLYMLVLIQEEFIIAVNISDLQNPRITSQKESLGAVFGVQGKYQSNYFFIAEGEQGISIIDLRQLPDIVFVSQIYLDGYSVHLRLLQMDTYIISSEQSGGQIALVNIQNIIDPYIVSQSQFQNEQSVATEISKDLSNLFILNLNGIRIFPIKTNLLIDFEFSQILNTNAGQIKVTIQNTQDIILFVGQNIVITLNNIYPEPNASITNAYLSQKNKLQILPPWLSFDNYLNQLSINVIKECLTESTNKNYKSQQIYFKNVVFVTKLKLSQESFVLKDSVQDSFIITSEQSKQIFQNYKNFNILDSLNQVSDQFCQNEQFNVPSLNAIILTQQGQAFVKKVLQESVIYSTLKLKIKGSLKIDFSNEQQIIQSVSQTASVTIQIDNLLGKFVFKSYAGAIISYSKEQDILQLQGDIANLNQILVQQLKVYFYNNLYNDCFVKITIDDHINYHYESSLVYKDISSIFSIKKNIKIKNNQSLQQQVNRAYSDSVIYIDTENQVQFSTSMYEFTNFKDLSFQAYQIEGDNLISLNSQINLVNFYPQQFIFKIKPQINDYNKNFCFMLNATDSYSWTKDQFCVKASGISLILFLNWMLKYLGFTLFLLGLLKYWYVFFNKIFAQKNRQSEIKVSVGQEFIQKIIVVNDSFEISSLFFFQFQKHLKHKYQNQIKLQHQKTINILRYANKQIVNIQDQDFLKCQNANQKQIQNLIQKTKNRLTKFNKNKNYGYEEYDSYTNESNFINKQKFFSDLLEENLSISYNKKKLFPKNYQTDFKDEDSIMYNCIYGILLKDLLNKNKFCQLIYQFIQEYCQIVSNDNSVKAKSLLAKSKFETKKKQSKQEKLIPDVQVNINLIHLIISLLLDSIPDKNQTLFSVDFNLIVSNIIHDQIGICKPTKSRLFPNSGESIHLLEQDIKKVEILTKKKFRLKQFFKQMYVPLLSRKNQYLPFWLEIQINKQCITLNGKIPPSNHYEELKICIKNNSNCIVREYIIKITQNEEQELLSENEINSHKKEFQIQPQAQHKLQKKNLRLSTFRERLAEKIYLQNDVTNNSQHQKHRDKKLNHLPIQNQLEEELSETDFISHKNINQINRKLSVNLNKQQAIN